MKHYTKLFFAAAVSALGLASCAKEVAPVETPKDNLVTVHFGATAGIEGATKATLTPNEQETLFTSDWENGDVLSVEYSNDNGTEGTKGTVSASWATNHFEAKMPEYHGMWNYNVVYPAPDTESAVDFGSARTQKGNVYNSKYDLMKGGAIEENADAGKTADRKNIVFNMTRQTAIAYFHLTSDLDEKVVSAKLSVTDGYIASSLVMLLDHTDGFDLSTKDLNEITITFEEDTAPKASNFQLWFNVLPTEYSKMTLTVETTNNTLTISRTAKGTYEAGKLYKVVKDTDGKWVKKGSETPDTKDFVLVTSAPSDWSGSYLLVGEYSTKDTPKSSYYAFDESVYENNTWGKCSEVVVDNNTIASTYGTMALEIVPGTTENTYSILTPSGKYLSASAPKKFNLSGTYSANDCDFSISFDANNDIVIKQASSTNRQIRYNHNNGAGGLRWYDGTTSEVVYLYKGPSKTALETPANLKVSDAKVVSWNTVSGAASYNVTIGTETYTSNTNSYYAAAITDDYYDVSVVAVPTDKENYKNSAAATLTGAKFGTPKLTTPELTEGAIDETSIRVNMTVDARATNGCTCEIYNGETLVDSKTITVKYVVFSGLESGVTYTIKINAIAVEGEKPYAASDAASIELKTKPAQHVSDVTATGTYTIKGLTVYAVANPSVAIAGDNTGYILVYKSSHGLKVGNTFNVAGTVKDYNGVWEFDRPSITGKATGETPAYPDAIEADEAYLASYGTATKIEYVHAKGIQSGKNIKVGAQTLYMSAENPETDGKSVEVSGFVYGYISSKASFVATSIKLDNSVPFLTVDQTSKVWAADATDDFVVKVAVNSEGGDWNVNPTALDWASITVDKTAGTITVTPNGANTNETANEATLTVAHTSDASLKKEITLQQNAAGGAAALVEYVSTFTDKNLNTKEKTMTWTSSLEANGFETRGVQFGAAKGKFTITGTGHKSNVKKISVIISTNNAGNTISATVGDVTIGKEISLTKKDNYEIVFESTTELSGDIVFNVNDKAKSVYIKSITVNPSSAN